jgi:hypothetical protein
VFPKQTEALAMPRDQRVRFDDGEAFRQSNRQDSRANVSGWHRSPGEVSLPALYRESDLFTEEQIFGREVVGLKSFIKVNASRKTAKIIRIGCRKDCVLDSIKPLK